MTSDRQEGWGAVMNEAMNSGCVVVADVMEGAARYLIKQGVNGFHYRKASAKVLAGLINPLLDDQKLRDQMGRCAYATIAGEWNAQEAAERMLLLCQDVTSGKEPQIRWESGPCSVAEIISERDQ